MHWSSAGRGHNDTYGKLLNNGVWEARGKGEYQTKVKYIHSWKTLSNLFEH
jgi:hypothetical protein